MLCIFLLCLIIKPDLCVAGARQGLLLWANRLLPSLLPFLILSKILIQSGYLSSLIKKTNLSYQTFVLLAGTFFGFPMGCKLTYDLYEQKLLNKDDATILFCASNHMSPAFVGSFLLSETLKRPDWMLPTFIILYLPSIIYGMIALKIIHRNHPHISEPATKKSTSGLQLTFTIVDAGIMNSFETMLKLGGYIMLFSVICELLSNAIGSFKMLKIITIGMLEITGAVKNLASILPSVRSQYIAMLAATAFGGCCGIAQTASIIHTNPTRPVLSIKRYLLFRIILAFVTAILAAIAYPFLSVTAA